MPLLDLHCDTFYRIYKYHAPASLNENSFHVDLNKLQKGNALAQCFAIFIDSKEERQLGKSPYTTYLEMLNLYQQELLANEPIISPVHSFKDIAKNQASQRISAILTVEEGAVLEGSLSRLEALYQDGVRMITLTWNYPNEIGFPNTQFTYQQKGLTPFGCQVVELMNDLGMVVDVSHLSDKGFEDVFKISKKPFVASHSNSRAIHHHSRNLTDEMIKSLANSGGLMGINFCSDFLGTSQVSRVEDMIHHIQHIKKVGGIEVIGIGTDFDGIDSTLEIEDYSQMGKLIEALEKSRFTPFEIDKILYQNGLRLLSDVI